MNEINSRFCSNLIDLNQREDIQQMAIKITKNILDTYKTQYPGKEYPTLGLIRLD